MNIESFKELPLWQSMVKNSGSDEVVMVEKHIKYILPLMERYVDTFPKYTLHNRDHIFNVIRIMGDLLGEKISNVSGLEAVILILSAVYHDYGMVFTENERKSILGNPNFHDEFLAENHGAKVLFEENKRKLTDDLLEWYCRWAHARRVWIKLSGMEEICGELLWKKVPIRIQIGNVCESHNQTAEEIRINDRKFDPDFLKICDLRFCALLLRVADILDFDNSRSPQSVYDYLDLDNPKNKAEKISKDEWNKHLASIGFQFSNNPKGDPISFIAAPPHPYIEHGIRTFLDLIDLELAETGNVCRRNCSTRWQSFLFPDRIDQSNIISKNYLSGKYRFSLSEDKILDLLTGDDLYTNDFIFIRELLQNAIDTVRHRTFVEKITNKSFNSSPIQVSYFKDSESYYWLRIDDEGMGMNQEIIQSHLLNKGNSYYNSDLFKIEKIKIREAGNEDFVPISRFGIGLLSCFLTCDKIEISTCYQKKGDDKKFPKNRLSIEGRGGFWVIRSDELHHTADRMPSEKGWETGYKTNPGTSIACRIKTSREYQGLDMKRIIEQFLLAPEIPVIFKGEYLGGDLNELVRKPWCNHTKTMLPDKFIQKCSKLLKTEVEQIEIEVRPINLHHQSSTPNLSGQLVIVIPRIKLKNDLNTKDNFKLFNNGNQTEFICEKTEKNKIGKEIVNRESIDISYILTSIKFPDKFLEEGDSYKFKLPRVSHNGIVIYYEDRQLSIGLNNFDQYQEISWGYQNFYLTTGIFWFRDSLLPDVTVSRNVIKNISDEIIANLYFATRELNEYTTSPNDYFFHFPKIKPRYKMLFDLGTLEKSELYQKNKPYWNSIPCINIKNKGISSIDDALDFSKNGPFHFRILPLNSPFFNQFAQYMVEKNFLVTFVNLSNDFYLLEAKYPKQEIVLDKDLQSYPPLTFLECKDSMKVSLMNCSLNKLHPLSIWIIKWSKLINKDYSYLSMQLFNGLLSNNKTEIKVKYVNEILDRFRDLLPFDAKPSKDLNVSEENFFPNSIQS